LKKSSVTSNPVLSFQGAAIILKRLYAKSGLIGMDLGHSLVRLRLPGVIERIHNGARGSHER
jgi:hypothetical protein